MRTIGLFLWAIVTCSCAADPPPNPYDPVDTSAYPKECHEHCFDRGAAARGLGEAANDIAICSKPNEPQGSSHVQVTFGPDGHVASAVVDQPPLDTAPSKSCIEEIFARVTVPPFEGEPVKVGKSFSLHRNADGGA